MQSFILFFMKYLDVGAATHSQPNSWKTVMFTTPEDWALVAREMFDNQPDARVQFADFDRLVAQELTDKRAWDELESFYAEAASETLTTADFERLRGVSTDEFEMGVLKMLKDALARASKDRQVKAIYCEYVVTAAKQCQLAAHMCTGFSSDHDSWAAETGNYKASLEGPTAPGFLDGLPSGRKNSLATGVYSSYANARLLAAWGRAVQTVRPSLPVAFSQHGLPIVRLMPQGK